MGNLIEVEIENKSYIKLIDLEQPSKGSLKLTTLVDNQPRVIIKIFLNKDGSRIPLKEYEVGHIRPEASGIPRFELNGSYDNKRLHLTLKVDGRKTEDSEIKLTPYLRNKYLPLYIIIGIIAALLLIWGGIWLVRTIFQPIEVHKTTSKEAGTTKVVTQHQEIIKIPEVKEQIIMDQSDNENTNKIDKSIVIEKTSIINRTVYFNPNNTTINKDASLLLEKLLVELKNNTTAVVKISGHCAMSGTEKGREELSRERAFNIAAFLKQKGWDPETEPVVRWYGGTQPVTTEEEEIHRNRRVEITIEM